MSQIVTLKFNVMIWVMHDPIDFVYSENKRNLIQFFSCWKVAKMDISATQSKIYKF